MSAYAAHKSKTYEHPNADRSTHTERTICLGGWSQIEKVFISDLTRDEALLRHEMVCSAIRGACAQLSPKEN